MWHQPSSFRRAGRSSIRHRRRLRHLRRSRCRKYRSWMRCRVKAINRRRGLPSAIACRRVWTRPQQAGLVPPNAKSMRAPAPTAGESDSIPIARSSVRRQGRNGQRNEPSDHDQGDRGRNRDPEFLFRCGLVHSRSQNARRHSFADQTLAHDPEKCVAVFRKDHAQTTN